MSDTRVRDDALPKGRVNEVCQEWMVREDGALAYRLQNEEYTDHLSGNRFRNAVVREDFPKAKTEQMREQQLAEQTAMIYQQMLAEQEEHDKLVARQLAEQLEREERQKRRALEVHDQDVARQLLERERLRVEQRHLGSGSPARLPHPPHPHSPQRPLFARAASYEGPHGHPSPHRPDPLNYQANLPPPLSSRRQAKAMPLPPEVTDLYTEPYRGPAQLATEFDRIDIADDSCVPLDELTERQIQEEKDAELARKLQEQEGNLEDTLLQRDRLLAIEAQDKELAKMLQERERSKARKARERAKQKALAKKQQQQQMEQHSQPQQLQQQLQQQPLPTNQILPDDSYSFPADLILPPRGSMTRSIPGTFPGAETYALPDQGEDDLNYSLPADVLPPHSFNSDNNHAHNQSSSSKSSFTTPPRSYEQRYYPGDKMTNGIESPVRRPSIDGGSDRGHEHSSSPVRPTQLDLKSPLTRINNKYRFPSESSPPDGCEAGGGAGSITPSPSPQHVNIAMAIDPTYPRRAMQHSSSSFDTSSGTVTTSTSSSSPGMMLPPPPDAIAELEDDNSVAPPYMPIQGQRRTASLEKKHKKKGRDGGCKQQ